MTPVSAISIRIKVTQSSVEALGSLFVSLMPSFRVVSEEAIIVLSQSLTSSQGGCPTDGSPKNV